MEEGVAKSRFTVADVKWKCKEELAGTFSPTPSAIAVTMFEVVSLHRGWPIQSCDVISAYPHAREESETFARTPPEYIEVLRDDLQQATGKEADELDCKLK